MKISREKLIFLRPLQVLEVNKTGAYKDVTVRFLSSYLGEDLLLDTECSYVFLGEHTGNAVTGYGVSRLWRLDDSEPAAIKKNLIDNARRNAVSTCFRSMERFENWATTSTSRKGAFCFSAVTPGSWGRIWCDYTTYILTSDAEKLFQVAPWLGSLDESYVFRNMVDTVLEAANEENADSYLRYTDGIAEVARSKAVSEPPPLIINYDFLDEFIMGYSIGLRDAHKGGFPNKEPYTFVDCIKTVVCTQFALARRFRSMVKDQSPWRWLKDLTNYHINSGYRTYNSPRVLGMDTEAVNTRSVRGPYSLTTGQVAPGVSLKMYFKALKEPSLLLSSISDRINRMAQASLKKSNAHGANRRALQIEYKLFVRDQVRRKGSVKEGEKILREVMDFFEEEVLKSPAKYKAWVLGDPDVSTPARSPMRFDTADVAASNSKKEAWHLMGSSTETRGFLLMAYCLASKCSEEPPKVPAVLNRIFSVSECQSKMIVRAASALCESLQFKQAMPFLQELVDRYSTEERGTRSSSIAQLDTPFTTLNYYVTSTSSAGNEARVVTGASTLAEFIYNCCRQMEKEEPALANKLLKEMALNMKMLREGPDATRVRSLYEKMLLRSLADPEYWSPIDAK